MLFSSAPEYLVAGLGNPGKEYEKTRHNIGFRVTDALAQEAGSRLSRLRFHALTDVFTISGKKTLVIQPQTMMNASGLAVEPAAAFYRIPPEKIILISDDVALPVGKIRIRTGGSAGGHNGLKSVIAALGTDGFIRVRVGVGEKPHPDYDLADWVLGRFSAQEESLLKDALERAADAVKEILRNGPEAAASRYNGL